MRLKKTHPWNPGYALPAHILGELGPLARTSPTRPRGTYDDPTIPPSWDAGYALPGNVRNERPGQDVHVSPWRARGTGGRGAPSEYAANALEGLGALPPRRTVVRDHSKLARGQAAVGSRLRLGSAQDPIAGFGTDGAAALMRAANSAAAPGDRIKVLRAMLNAIDPAMWAAVDAKMAKQKARGVNPKQGLPRAVAAALANHFAGQVVQAGKSGRAPLSGVMGIAQWGEDAHAHQTLSGYMAAEGFEGLGWSIGGALSSAVHAVGKAASATGSAIKSGVNATGRGIRDATKATGNAIADAAKATYNAAKSGLNALGNLACKAANSGVLTLAAQGAGMAAGGPAGAAAGGQGASVVQGLCSKDASGQALVPQQPAPPSSSGMSTTTLLLIGGAGLGALLLLR